MKGDRLNPTNYRHISLLTFFWKVLEKALCIVLSVNSNYILVENQLGFRKGVENQDAIFKLTNDILNALNN